jgi:hypothetical protein
MKDLKTMNVAQGIITFANALIGQHHANREEVLGIVVKDLQRELNVISASDPDRNK